MKRKPRPIGLPPIIVAGIRRAERERKAAEIARPMRELFRQLAEGEVCEVDGKAVMSMPDLDPGLRQSATEWVEIAPAVEGWIDLWERIAPRLRQDKLRVLAERLRAGQDLTPRLIELASEQFEASIALIPGMRDGEIESAVRTQHILWELDRAA